MGPLYGPPSKRHLGVCALEPLKPMYKVPNFVCGRRRSVGSTSLAKEDLFSYCSLISHCKPDQFWRHPFSTAWVSRDTKTKAFQLGCVMEAQCRVACCVAKRPIKSIQPPSLRPVVPDALRPSPVPCHPRSWSGSAVIHSRVCSVD